MRHNGCLRQAIASLVGCAGMGTLAFAQFAAERTTPAPFGGAQPPVVAPTPKQNQPQSSTQVPAGQFSPLPASTPAETGKIVYPAMFVNPPTPKPNSSTNSTPFLGNPSRRQPQASYVPSTTNVDAPLHPWSVKAEHGAWMICVRGYTGSDSLKLAEKLCQEIREKHRVAAYLFSRNAEELKREKAQVEAIRKAEIARQEPFLKAVAEARKVAAAEGRPFEETPIRIRTVKPYHEAPEQWAVLIGGFPNDKAARDALSKVRQLPPPQDTELMDPIIAETGNRAEGTYLNPYSNSIVVPNPATAKAAADEKYKLEPFVVKLNEDVKYSLLKVRKPWTLQVKSYTTPMRVVGKGSSEESVFERALGAFSKKSMLDVTAEQAEQLAQSLRQTTHPELREPFEAHVLHHRTGSLVFVGQFEAIDDPALVRMQKLLQGMTFKIKTRDGREEDQKMFDAVSPTPVPKF